MRLINACVPIQICTAVQAITVMYDTHTVSDAFTLGIQWNLEFTSPRRLSRSDLGSVTTFGEFRNHRAQAHGTTHSKALAWRRAGRLARAAARCDGGWRARREERLVADLRLCSVCNVPWYVSRKMCYRKSLIRTSWIRLFWLSLLATENEPSKSPPWSAGSTCDARGRAGTPGAGVCGCCTAMLPRCCRASTAGNWCGCGGG